MQTEARGKAAALRNPLFLFFLATLILAAETVVFLVRWILIAVLIAVALGVLLTPLMRGLESRLKVPRSISAFLFFTLSLGLVAGISLLVYSLMADQLVPLAERSPELLREARARISEFLARFPGLQQRLQAIDFSGAIGAFSQNFVHGIKIGASALGGFVFVLILGLYLAVSPDYYLEGMLSVLPPARRTRARQLLGACASTLRHWFSSQLIAMLAVGSGTALGLLVIGIDDWLLFGALTALLDIIPYIGPLVAGISTVLVTLATKPERTLWVIGIFLLMQQIEGHLIIPWVMKGRIDLPPAQLIVLMLIMGTEFGILGILIAPGLLAVLRTLYLEAYLPWIEGRSP